MNVLRRISVALVGAVLVAAAACTDRSPLAPATPAPSADLLGSIGQATGLLSCTPMPADSATETIGPAGGTLYVGPHRLVVPAGALAVPVTITAVAPSDTVNQVRFHPEGVTFAEPAYLTMSYANCNLLGVLVPKRIAYTTDALDILEYLLSFDNLWTRKVTGRLEHFSTYAVAW